MQEEKEEKPEVDSDEDSDAEAEAATGMSKKKLKQESRMAIAALKQARISLVGHIYLLQLIRSCLELLPSWPEGTSLHDAQLQLCHCSHAMP